MANNNGVVIINQDFTIDWLDLLAECNLKTVGLHSLYSTGGLDGHLHWRRASTARGGLAFAALAFQSVSAMVPSKRRGRAHAGLELVRQ